MNYPYSAAAPQIGHTTDDAELSARNVGASSIAAGLYVLLDTTSLIDSAPSDMATLGIAARLPTVSEVIAGGVLGMTIDAIPAGTGVAGRVQRRGTRGATAAGSITAGQFLSVCTLANKLGWLQTAASGEVVVAMALQSPSDADTFEVLLLSPFIHT